MSSDLSEQIAGTNALAREAKAVADLANQRMNGHEELCAERYNNIRQSISQLESIIKTAGAVLGCLVIQTRTMQQQRISSLEAHSTSSHQTRGGITLNP